MPSTAYSFAPLFAESYSQGFMNYWAKSFQKADTIVLFAVDMGVVCIAIIMMSGKWKK